jgi:hypothetical protein
MLTAMRAWRPALQRAPSDGIILIIERAAANRSSKS